MVIGDLVWCLVRESRDPVGLFEVEPSEEEPLPPSPQPSAAAGFLRFDSLLRLEREREFVCERERERVGACMYVL